MHDKAFCCRGCQTVFELLTESGLTDFYQLSPAAGVRIKATAKEDQFRYLDEPGVRTRLVDFTDARSTRVTFRLPAIHCIACVWLLENLFRLRPGLGETRVNFPRRELALSFDHTRVRLSEIVALLASLGYEPDLKFSDLENSTKPRTPRRLWLQLGIAGFAFGNTMLFSLCAYLGLDSFSGPQFQAVTGYLSLVLALPVVAYSASDYWRSAWISLREKLLTIEVPIAAGIAALFIQSVYEVVCGQGAGYFDSLAGLLFFLLSGKLFQQKTFDQLAFDRDYKSFFPLSVKRKRGGKEQNVSLSELVVGDRLMLRNGELIPADARLVSGAAMIDYSFVTGEAEPLEKLSGDYLYAGGRQIGGTLEVEMVKPVSQGYLTSLWNQDAFHKPRGASLDTLTNRYSQRFTKIIIVIAIGAAVFWWFRDPRRAVKAFTSVLIVACPCALALAAPFALGTAQRVLARRQVFLKNPQVLETLTQVDTVVFDKTGTLTAAGAGAIVFHGAPLTEAEEGWLYSVTRHSTHPYAVRIGADIARQHFPEPVRSFLETAGGGMEGSVSGREIWMGSAAWLASRGGQLGTAGDRQADGPALGGSVVHVAIDGVYRGYYELASALRPQTAQLLDALARNYELALLSGDNAKQCARFTPWFGESTHLRFNQSPLTKLGFIQELQQSGRTVLMVGDGLNDAGALRQSDVGIAVVENINAFSPASDVILAAPMVVRLADVLRFSQASVGVVQAAFLISTVYNLVGISIAASGNLSPVVCAILMPLSSVTVVAFACGMTSWWGRRLGPVRDLEARS